MAGQRHNAGRLARARRALAARQPSDVCQCTPVHVCTACWSALPEEGRQAVRAGRTQAVADQLAALQRQLRGVPGRQFTVVPR